MSKPLYGRILSNILEVAEQRAKGFCQSRQLRGTMNRQVLIDTPLRAYGVVNVPQYWAIYYHEGRRVISPVSANFLVWFKDPKDDPRLNNGQSPIYESDIRRLNLPLQELRRLRDAGKLVITKRSPRSGSPSFKGNPFFSDKPGGGLAGIDRSFVSIAERETFKYVDQWLRKTGLKNKKITKNL
jgi:hypothetical protein